jgi:hypothetical protein
MTRRRVDRDRRELERARHLIEEALQPIGPELSLRVRELERLGDVPGLELLGDRLRESARELLAHARDVGVLLGDLADFDALWSQFGIHEWLYLRARFRGESTGDAGARERLVDKRMLLDDGGVTPLGIRFYNWVTPSLVEPEGGQFWSQSLGFHWRGVLFAGSVVDDGSWTVHHAGIGHVAIRVDPSYWGAPGAERFGRGVQVGVGCQAYYQYAVDQWAERLGISEDG